MTKAEPKDEPGQLRGEQPSGEATPEKITGGNDPKGARAVSVATAIIACQSIQVIDVSRASKRVD